MHQCLVISEIFQEILENIHPRPDPNEDSGLSSRRWLPFIPRTDFCDLFSLARTAKIFLEPCLDALWREVYFLVPIIVMMGVPKRVLINALVGLSSDGSSQKLVDADIESVILHADLHRVLYYLAKIRTLRIARCGTTMQLLHALYERFHGLKMSPFSNLRHLIWKDLRGGFYAYSEMFNGPKLTRLSLHPPSLLESGVSFSELRRSYPDVLEIEFHSGFEDQEQEDMSELTYDFPDLQVFDCRGFLLDEIAIFKLSMMPNLRSLDIGSGIRLADEIHLYIQYQHQAFFPSLSKLVLGKVDLIRFNEFFRALPNPHLLHELKIGCTGSPAFCNFLAAIKERCDSDTLTDLHVSLYDVWTPLAGPGQEASYELSITPSILRPLLSFRNMRDCSVCGHLLFCDDAFLKVLAAAWPYLCRLVLLPRPEFARYSHITLRGLIPLAKSCPQLQTLMINLALPQAGETAQDHMSYFDEQGGISSFSKVKMWLGNLDMVDASKAPDIALYLKTVFPNIVQVSDGHVNYWINYDKFAHLSETDYVTRHFNILQFPDWVYDI